MKEQNVAKKRSRLSGWIRRLIFPGRELGFLEEEMVQSPFRSMLRRFLHNKIAMTGVTIFLVMLALVTIGPKFYPLDLTYSDGTQLNIPPTRNLMKLPDGLSGKIGAISVGPTYGVGCDTDGNVYTWGYTRITATIDLANIPEQVRKEKIIDVAAGYDHILALSDKGKLYVWGNNRLGQADIPELANRNKTFVQIGAAMQFSVALTDEGQIFVWGNTNSADAKMKKEFQGHVKRFALADSNYICLMDDGSVKYTAYKTSSAYASVPAGLESGVVDIAGTATTFTALKEDGTTRTWGIVAKGEGSVPEHEGKIERIFGGRYHYTAVLDNGQIIAWGDNHFGQSDVPAQVSGAGKELENLYTGYYQNYALLKSGEVATWGLKGYWMGTDYLGRDILNRLVNGGRVTMTVGAVAVIICTILGLLIGGIAGYFGGKLDIILMRVAEVVNGIPFLPFAMILSSIIPSTVTITQRMYLIMVVMGALQWPSLSTLVRAQILRVREQEYVLAAKAMGVRERNIIAKHIMPNILSVILVNVALSFATCMLYESSLSYLGFGIIPPTPTWGNMLTGCNNSVVIQQYWWRWVFPAIALGICTIAINLIGDGLRDAIDPKSEER